jgi:metallophosphoesterase (TIGR03767 family)
VHGRSGYRSLSYGPGERRRLRDGALGRARKGRQGRRRSLLYFGQITDPQLVDEMSPARAEWARPVGGLLSGTWRPQEALGVHTFDHTIRAIAANRTSPSRDGRGSRRRMQFAISTGDSADNAQENETRWFREILDGRTVDPYSGQPIDAGNPCPSGTPEQIARVNQAVANREYLGVQDYELYASAPQERKNQFWDPDIAPTAGPYTSYPRFPGLMDRAQRRFDARGIGVPWYQSRGNHDGLVAGGVPATNPLFTTIAQGCLKILPGAAFDPASVRGLSLDALFDRLGTLIPELLPGAGIVAPDADRRFLSRLSYKQQFRGRDRGHGFGYVDAGQNRASRGNATYYGWTPRPGFRFVAIDTVAEAGGAGGNIDDPQYRWLAHELDRNSSTEVRNGRIVRDGDRDRLIVIYGHHALQTLITDTPDEQAGVCTDPLDVGCDSDPRRSTPIHLGTRGNQSIKDLLLRFPNVIAFVNGHTHHNRVRAWTRGSGRDRSGFWEVNTASHIDFPQQSRLIEVMDNRDGTLSIMGTIVDQTAPIATPRSGARASGFSDTQLASIARRLAASNPGNPELTSGPGPYNRPIDRNVELVIDDPR